MITLSPALGFFDIYPMRYSLVADHYVYAASIGIFALLGFQIHAWMGQGRRSAVPVFFLAVIIILAGLSWKQSGVYKDNQTLYRDILKKNPQSYLAYNNLGTAFFRKKDYAQAKEYLTKALWLNPRSAQTHYNLAVLSRIEGRPDEAVRYLSRALELKPEHPNALYQMALILENKGDREGAIHYLKKTLRIYPSHLPARITARQIRQDNP